MSTDENPFRRVDWSGDQPLPSDDDDEHGLPVQPPRGPSLSAADLELLTLAARALGAVRVEAIEGEHWLNLHFADGSTMWNWNSLLHSDDAFVLGVRLNLFDEHPGFSYLLAVELGPPDSGRDPVDATRRAATRAAAEIGKTMA